MKGSVNEHQLTPDASVKHVYIFICAILLSVNKLCMFLTTHTIVHIRTEGGTDGSMKGWTEVGSMDVCIDR